MRRPTHGEGSRYAGRCVLILLLASVILTPRFASAQSNPIVIENEQPGTAAWDIGDNLANDTTGQIKGYASAVSVNKGQNITFYVSVNTAQTFTIDVYRIGYYQGLGGRLMQHIGPLNGTPQPACPMDAVTGMISCQWAAAYTLATQTSWTSGVYLCVLKNGQGYQNLMIFTVRDDSRVAAILYQSPVTTYQAYNDWPDDGKTGKSLYDFNSYGAILASTGYHSAAKVSFDRPYQDSGIDEGFRSDYGEVNFIKWMEGSGYDVTYATDIDTHANNTMLLNYKGVLSMGHDEYWSKPMYDGFNAARDAGVNLAFFGADAVSWQIRMESSSTGVANRVEVCYRDVNLDPNPDPTLKTVNWRDPALNRPEQVLMGIQYNDNSSPPQNGQGFFPSYVVTNSADWVYAGTGMTDGTALKGLIGYEADRYDNTFPSPNAVAGTYFLLSHSSWGSGQYQYANSSIYQAPSGAWVFASGTMNWNWALDVYGHGYNLVDPRAQQTTANILNRFVSSPGAGVSPTVAGIVPGTGSGSGGTVVTITGTNFVSGATVTFGTAAATGVTVVNSTTITATTPAQPAGPVSVTVTNLNTKSGTLSSGFTYTAPAPTVSFVTPSSGPAAGGTSITITGAGFVAGASVKIGGTSASGVVVVNGTTITATTPAGATGAVSVVVTNPDTQTGTLTNGFTYLAPPPTVTNVAPGTGSTIGGTLITITGTNFVAGATVSVGGNAATGVTVVNATTITASTPAGAVGAVSVTVTNADGQSASLANAFTYNLTAPTISSVSPNNGLTTGGTAITITGTNYVAGASVSIGGSPATGVIVVNATTITASTPAHAAGAVNVTVTNPDTQLGTLTNGFTYQLPAPTVTSVSPSTGVTLGGSAISITGTNFVAGATVSVGGNPATGVNVVNATTITATIPAHAVGAVNVTVTNPDTQAGTLTNGFTYQLPAPTVSSLTPTSGLTAGGTAITITGANFVAGATVNVGGNPATAVTVVNGTTITATTAAHAAGAVNVTVANPDAQTGTLTNGYTYVLPAPTVTSVLPNTGLTTGGTAISITGNNFVTGATVSVGGNPATSVTVVNGTTITATTAAHAAGAVNVTVTNPDAQTGTLTNGFTYVLPAPTLTSVTPGSGPTAGGTPITVSGTNFVAGATVSVGGSPASGVTVVNATTITATTPAGAAGTANVTVTNPDAQIATLSNAFTYSLTAPTVSSVSPNAGLTTGGTTITITGTNFVSGATVSVGGSPASGVTFVNSTTISATTPVHAAGAVNVTVTNPDSQSGTLVAGFTYVLPAPTVSSVLPNTGLTTGGTVITITGTNFVTGATVSVGGNLAAGVTVVNGTSITATTPAHAAGAASVTVTNTDGQNATLTNSFTYVLPAPTVTNVSPNTGVTTGGTSITITGANFVAGATVSVGGNPATAVTVVNGTTITATTAAHAPGAVNVSVTNPDAQTGTLTNGYTYVLPAPTVTSVLPNTGLTTGGTAISITGNNFVTGATVSVGGNPAASVNVVNGTTITATTPAHAAGAVNVTVTNPDTQTGTLTNGFTYVLPAPTLTSVTPGSGSTAGGTPITVSGTNFVAGATVSVGGSPASGVTVVNATTITATTPAHAAGAVNVIVTNTDGQSATLASGYTYVLPAPTIASVSPNSGPTTGGTGITITGANFVAGATVSMGGSPASAVTVVNATTITASAPAHAAGAVNVIVTNPDSQSATLANGFTFTTGGPTFTAPSGLTATAFSPVQIVLLWTPATETGGTISQYLVERCSTAGCSNFVQVGTSTTTTYNDTGLSASTSYSYRVRATDASNNLSPYSNTASATTPSLAASGINFVQGNYADPQSTTQSTVNVTYTAAQIAGDLNVVVVGWNDANATVTSVTDQSGNVYTRAVGPTVLASGGLSQSIYYSANIKAANAGANIVAVVFSVGAAYPDIRIMEYSGADPNNPVDVFAAGSGSSTADNSGSVSTNNPMDLLFAANIVGTSTPSPGSGFTTRLLTSPDSDIVEDKMVTATGSYSATTGALVPSGPWIMQMVAFRTPVANVTPPTTPGSLTATAVSTSQINLSWTASTDSIGIAHYAVQRCQGASCNNFVQIGTATGTSYSDAGLLANANYTYRVQAFDPVGTPSPFSNTASATVEGPSLASIAPGTGQQGSSVPVTLTGTGLTGATAITVSGSGVTVTGLTVVNDTTVTATFTISATATLSARTVSITTTPGVISNTVTFTVAPAAAPSLTSVSPNSGVRSTAVPVTLHGANFTATGTKITVSGSGVTVSNTTVVDSGTLNATFTISATATASARNVTVTTPGGTTNAVTFTVQGPTLTSVSPNPVAHGTGVSLTLTGTNLAGATGITLGTTGDSCTVSNSTATSVSATCTLVAGTTTAKVVTPIGTTGTVSLTVN